MSKSPNGAWWGPILEKTAAKFYGRYENMDGGTQQESLYLLTGMPTHSLPNAGSSESKIWNSIIDWDKRNYVMTASVLDNGLEGGYDGLATGHAYTLIGAQEYNGVKLIKIRNPWGSESYKGKWSDDDKDMWTQDAQTKLKHTMNKEDGIFYVPLDRYKTLFFDTIVAYYQNWEIARQAQKWDRSQSISSVSVSINNPVA